MSKLLWLVRSSPLQRRLGLAFLLFSATGALIPAPLRGGTAILGARGARADSMSGGLPARPRLADIIAATSRRFGVEQTELRRRRHTPARLALAYVARHAAALKLLEFSPALGIRGWAASQLATAAERLAQKNRRFRQSLRRIQQSLAELTNQETCYENAVAERRNLLKRRSPAFSSSRASRGS